ncbi:MAG: endolytic transglycosylase MltG [Bacteroidales bacterium]|nr:endolytic transglycosylase MltG [Bacteroidales bacterium]
MKKKKKGLKYALIGLFVTGSLVLLGMYLVMFAPNVKKDGFLYIPTGSTYQQVQDSLQAHDFLKNSANFDIWQRIKSYYLYVKPGRYELRKGMTNRQLVAILRSGRQTPTKLTFNNIRTLDQLAEKVSAVIEADFESLRQAFSDPDFLEKHQLSAHEVKAIFIPNTYELWWNTSAQQFVERMRSEHEKFWNDERRKKAKARNLTPIQVSIIASIVEEETKKNDEKPLVASVYINRLRKGMPLQADPTVKYAIGDFGLRRILHVHLKHDSPFNTYIYGGLPPGPISFPSVSSLDAVLNSPPTDYLFFCASSDFSGYHVFAKTYSEHLQNARKYHDALNRNRIR